MVNKMKGELALSAKGKWKSYGKILIWHRECYIIAKRSKSVGFI